MKYKIITLFLLLTLVVVFTGQAVAEPEKSKTAETTAKDILASAAQQNKYTFLLVREQENDEIVKFRKAVKEALKKRPEKIISYELDVNNSSETETIKKFQLEGAPLPIILVIAPNQAVTAGLTSRNVSQANLVDTIVSPKTEELLKLLQEGKLVLLSVQNKDTNLNQEALSGVKEFLADAKFAPVSAMLKVDPSDNKEKRLMQMLRIDEKTKEAHTVVLAPPMAMVGSFSGATTKNQIVTALTSAMSGVCGASNCGSAPTCGPDGCD